VIYKDFFKEGWRHPVCKKNAHYIIDDFGIVDNEQQIKNTPNSKIIEKVKGWLLSKMKPSSKRSSFSSYWLKHQAETDMGIYVSNGVMIMALLKLGYRIYRVADSKNCYVYGVLNETA